MSKRLSAVLRESASLGSDRGLTFIHMCPGCGHLHQINVEKPNHCGAKWSFDGNVEAPTFSPSINIVGQCHYFIRSGHIQYCSDSKHALAGKTVPLPAAWLHEDETAAGEDSEW